MRKDDTARAEGRDRSRRGRRRRLGLVSATAAMLVAAGVSCADAPPCHLEVYPIDDMPVCQFGDPARLTTNALNDEGYVAGSWSHCADIFTEAFVWHPDHGMTTLPRPEGSNGARANDINDSGLIVGAYTVGSGAVSRACVWIDGEVHDLHPLLDGTKSEAFAVNGAGQVVGYWSSNSPSIRRGFVWQDGRIVDHSDTIELPYTWFEDINESGLILGRASTGLLASDRGFTFKDGSIVGDIGPVPGEIATVPVAINDLGQVTGYGYTSLADAVPFVWHEGHWTLFEPLPGYSNCGPTDINNRGQVVGLCIQSATERMGFVWSRADGIRTTTSLLQPNTKLWNEREWKIESANERGQFLAGAAILSPDGGGHGDLDCNGLVELADLLSLLSQWGPCSACVPDLDDDEQVDQSDLIILIDHWSG